MTAWLNRDEHYTPNLPSVREALENIQHEREDINPSMGEYIPNVQNHIDDAKAEWRQAHEGDCKGIFLRYSR